VKRESQKVKRRTAIPSLRDGLDVSRLTPHVFSLERAMGFEPHSVVSSALKPASLTPAEGASPLARSPRKGLTPFGIPTAVGSILFYPAPHVSRIMIHASRLPLERAMGFEPTTASLEGWNSTTELRPPFSSSALSFSLVQVVHVRSALATCLHHSVVGRQGFEPWKPMATDLQSAPFGHLGTCPKHLACDTK
jgi:hypothetical protein